MLNYLYLKLVSLWFDRIKQFYYGTSAWKSFFVYGLNYWKRDEMTRWRAESFIPYIFNQKYRDDFLEDLDEVWRTIAIKSIDNIKKIVCNNYCLYDDLYDDRLVIDQKNFAQYVLSNKWKYFPNFDYLYLTNDYYLHTLDGLCNDVNWKDILDCGAFMWDTAVPLSYMFSQSKIYWFEPEFHNYQKFQNIITYNQLQDHIIAVKQWVWDKYTMTTISDGWAGAKIWEKWEEVEIIPIDQFVSEKELQVGLIKRDIEWFEYESVVWSEQTIKKYKPVLIISLYHRGKDFFEIKKMIEWRDLWYKFTVRKWNCFHPFADTVLICYH